MTSRETAHAITKAHSEIVAAETTLAEINKTLSENDDVNLKHCTVGDRPVWTRVEIPIQPDVYVFHVPLSLARALLEGYIAQQRVALAALDERARVEIGRRPPIPALKAAARATGRKHEE